MLPPLSVAWISLTDAQLTCMPSMLQFLSEWLARDPDRLSTSLAEFADHPAYGLGELRGDPERFVLPLGGSDGEQLFGS